VFLLEKPNPGLNAVGRMNLIVRLEQHAQTLARADFVIDDENLGQFQRNGHDFFLPRE
jgi:hypothetical protein